MSIDNGNSPASALPSPGWYEDTSTPGLSRWWDGTQWTEHLQSQPQALAAAETVSPPRPTGEPVALPQRTQPASTAHSTPSSNTAWAWVLVALPILQGLVAILLDATLGRTPGVGRLDILGAVLLGTATSMGIAYLDIRALAIQGLRLSTPMLLWNLLGPWAYLLARSVSLRGSSPHRWIVFAISASLTALLLVASQVVATPYDDGVEAGEFFWADGPPNNIRETCAIAARFYGVEFNEVGNVVGQTKSPEEKRQFFRGCMDGYASAG